ncbi:type III CRISPR-associated RAMP protein Csx7 [Sulfurisphaera ohwakuensis]|uniref:CRISPR-associated RAMP protein n=1 Tax=Sulfurisphaera ohwakuensis TaxID=69656 RepID=A0A650CK63_SULOH|nr:CRISPR-associated RAMP protein Csx7 [Sulfurisphaera ohwakuensis]MBB5254610.1 CRISPR-associated RAMP protein (TIGR02581 family) [Sulfurisphaera ohwakuensis]QGR18261.1 CRISPR-associated RAMP protein [Sulfurisphaera ohwakuensis]
MNDGKPCYDLDVIRSIIKINGKIKNETPLRIGYGKSQSFTDPTDNLILKVNERPIIPGSSFKGALRSLAEAYVKSWNDPRYIVCDLDDNKCTSCNGEEKYCIPCIIFGFKDLSSRVYILDAIAEKYSISQRTMVTINRVFGGQLPGHLYTLDYVEPNSVFNFSMFLYNLNIVDGETEEWRKKAVEVVRYLLKTLITDGIFIGAKKSAGFGLVKLTSGEIEIRKSPDLMKPTKLDLMEVAKSW